MPSLICLWQIERFSYPVRTLLAGLNYLERMRMSNVDKAIKEIEAQVIASQAFEWNEERIGGLEIALDILYKLQKEENNG